MRLLRQLSILLPLFDRLCGVIVLISKWLCNILRHWDSSSCFFPLRGMAENIVEIIGKRGSQKRKKKSKTVGGTVRKIPCSDRFQCGRCVLFSFVLFIFFSLFILRFTIPGYQSRGADGDGRIDAGVFLENFLLFFYPVSFTGSCLSFCTIVAHLLKNLLDRNCAVKYIYVGMR